jgi:hypothetical protein
MTFLKLPISAALLIVLLSAGLCFGQEQASKEQEQTKRLREHGKLYKSDNKRKLSTLRAGEELAIIEMGESPLSTHPGADLEQLRATACGSDAVVIGNVVDSVSALTENETFVFTEHTLNVSEVLKNNTSAPISAGGQIVVTRPGGTLEINGGRVRAETEAILPFRVRAQYLLFLKFVHGTGAYRAYGPGSFELQGQKYVPLGMKQTGKEHRFVADLMQKVREALASPCR